MEFKGTKGKWLLNERYETINDENGNGIAQQNGIINCKNWIYDSQLILCAPEMLEMLIKTNELLLKDSLSIEQIKLRGKIEKLIKKATTI